MAAKKARKRAYIPPSSEVVNKRERTETTRTHRATASRPASGGAGARGVYEYPKPSLGRTLRRLPVYFLLILALQYYLNPQKLDGGDRWIASAMAAGIVTLIFAPFMHVMDRFAYNRYQRRHGSTQGTDPTEKS